MNTEAVEIHCHIQTDIQDSNYSSAITSKVWDTDIQLSKFPVS
jgi:hypothetical protein